MVSKKSTWYIHGDALRNGPAVYAALVSLGVFAEAPLVIRVNGKIGEAVDRWFREEDGKRAPGVATVIESEKLLKDERLTGLVVCWDTSENAQRMVERAQYLGAAVVQLIEPDQNAEPA